MAFRFPFSNLHELTLDWVLEQVKQFAELIPEIETSAEDIQQAIDKADNAQATADEAIELIEQVSGATPSDATPLVDGTATPGVSLEYSRGDHVHPTDTSRASAANLTSLQNQVNNITVPVASSDFPEMDGTASAGSSANYSRGDHVHPTDTSRASAANLTSLQNQVNNLVIPTPSNANPAMDGTATPGSSSNYSRADHVHPSDTNRAGIKSIAYSDIDNIAETGFYTTTGTVAVLYHIRWDGNYAFQMGNFFGETDVKYRIKTGGSWSAWTVLGGSTGTVIQNLTITLPASWTSAGTNIYTQTLSGLTNVTANTKIDLNPGAAAILQMVSDGTYAIYVENNNGTFTVYAIGSAPTAALTISGVRYETV